MSSNNLNSVLIEGVVMNTPQVSEIAKGKLCCNFVIASKRFYRGAGDALEEEISFVNVEAYSKLAETCGKLGKRGSGVRVVGRLCQKGWFDESAGRCPKLVLISEHVEFRPDFLVPEEELKEIEQEGEGEGGED